MERTAQLESIRWPRRLIRYVFDRSQTQMWGLNEDNRQRLLGGYYMWSFEYVSAGPAKFCDPIAKTVSVPPFSDISISFEITLRIFYITSHRKCVSPSSPLLLLWQHVCLSVQCLSSGQLCHSPSDCCDGLFCGLCALKRSTELRPVTAGYRLSQQPA